VKCVVTTSLLKRVSFYLNTVYIYEYLVAVMTAAKLSTKKILTTYDY